MATHRDAGLFGHLFVSDPKLGISAHLLSLMIKVRKVFGDASLTQTPRTSVGHPEPLVGERSCYTLLASIALKMELYWRSTPLGKVRKNLPVWNRLEA